MSDQPNRFKTPADIIIFSAAEKTSLQGNVQPLYRYDIRFIFISTSLIYHFAESTWLPPTLCCFDCWIKQKLHHRKAGSSPILPSGSSLCYGRTVAIAQCVDCYSIFQYKHKDMHILLEQKSKDPAEISRYLIGKYLFYRYLSCPRNLSIYWCSACSLKPQKC